MKCLAMRNDRFEDLLAGQRNCVPRKEVEMGAPMDMAIGKNLISIIFLPHPSLAKVQLRQIRGKDAGPALVRARPFPIDYCCTPPHLA